MGNPKVNFIFIAKVSGNVQNSLKLAEYNLTIKMISKAINIGVDCT